MKDRRPLSPRRGPSRGRHDPVLDGGLRAAARSEARRQRAATRLGRWRRWAAARDARREDPVEGSPGAAPPEAPAEALADSPVEEVAVVDREAEAGREAAPLPLQVELDADPRVHYALWQNDVPPVRSVRLEHQGDQRLTDLEVEVTVLPGPATAFHARLAQLKPGQTYTLEPVEVSLPPERLRDQDERERVHLATTVRAGGEVVGEGRAPLDLLAYNEWPGTEVLPEVLAAFVMPNHPALAPLLRAAARRLEAATGSGALDGYQSKDPTRARAMAQALYEAFAEMRVGYVNPPASFEAEGQKVLTPGEVLGQRLGTCLDLACVYAAACERVGLNPVLVLTADHAFAAVWTEPQHFEEAVVAGDPSAVRKRMRLGQLVPVELTAVTRATPPDFEGARDEAAATLADPGEVFYAVCVEGARRAQVRPLPSRAGEVAREPEDDLPGPVVFQRSQATTLVPGDDDGAAVRVARGPRGRLERWRSKLLDLTYRNRLLSFRKTRQTLRLEVPDLGALEDRLAEGGAVELKSLGDVDGDGTRDAHATQRRTGVSPREARVAEVFAAGGAAVDRPAERLSTDLRELYRVWRSGLEENGANLLYLTLGTLVYLEPGADAPRRAPVLLLPVELERLRGGRRFRMRRTDEEPAVNLTLLEKLRVDFDIDVPGLDPLPTDASGVDVGAIFEALRKAVLDRERWEVLDELHLTTLSFTKFLMWRDLIALDQAGDDQGRAGAERSPLIRHLIAAGGEDAGQALPPQDAPDLDQLDQVAPDQWLCPLDADSSQLRAVMAADGEASFVLEGPPGTGKSQTITNLIARSLAAGQTVLFVAEKRAALDVVYRRLASVGLGDFCLELHSNKVKKRHVLAQLGAALDSAEAGAPEDWERRCQALEETRAALNQVVEALHREHPSGWTVHRAVTRLVQLAGVPRVRLGGLHEGPLEAARLEAAQAAAAELDACRAALTTPPERHPWRAVGTTRWTPRPRREAEEALEALAAPARQAEAAARAAASAVGLDEGAVPGATGEGRDARSRLTARRRWAALCATLAESPPGGAALVGAAATTFEALEVALELGRRRDQARSRLGARYDLSLAMGLDLDELLRTFRAWKDSNFLARAFGLRGAWASLRGAVRGELPADAAGACADLVALRALAEDEAELEGLAPTLTPTLGPRALKDSPWDRHAAALAWARQLQGALAELEPERAGPVSEAIHRHLEARAARGAAEAPPALAAAFRDHEQLEAALGAVAERLEASPEALWVDAVEDSARGEAGEGQDRDRAEPGPTDAASLGEALARRAEGADLAALGRWVQLVEARAAARAAGLEELAEAVDRGELAEARLEDVTLRGALETWVEEVFEAEDALARFRGEAHHRRVERFRELDVEVLERTREVIRARLASRVPRGGGSSTVSPVGLLRRELQKKTRHLPVRRLLSEVRDLLPFLCPALLMSPLSVAQYLDPAAPPFDLVVFDEASQIPVWDAIGALARGRRAVVVGDPKQLPPTSFFQSVDDGDDLDVDEGAVTDLESILDECLGADVPHITLDWHYRSRHESLIAFSNREYYGGRLFTFPSPAEAVAGRGVSLVEVPDGFFDTGKSRTNEGEARALVAEIVRRLSDPAERGRSLGVVTFNLAQQRRIEDLLEAERRRHPAIDAYFTDAVPEPVFVKNLENVQGDERDVILFSICYGPTREGRVYMRFGPLNRDGGERRLNVAITRAREELVVFSTLRPEQIDLGRVRWPGVAHLRTFLEHARRGGRSAVELAGLDGPGDPSAGDDFAAVVARALADRGWQVERNLGCSGYRIDLAVRDPEDPARYLLGVETDGAGYRQAATARDRDRLRGAVLESLGWSLARVHATDWWMEPEAQAAALDAVVREAAERAARRRAGELPAAPLGGANAGAEVPGVDGGAEDGGGEDDDATDEDGDAAGEAGDGAGEAGDAAGEAGDAADEAGDAADEAGDAADDTKDATDEPGDATDDAPPTYTPWAPEGAGRKPEAFHDTGETRRLVNDLFHLLRAEAPVTVRLAGRRLARAWGVERMTDVVEDRVDEVVEAGQTARRWKLVDGLLWLATQDPRAPVPVRVVAEPEDSRRDAEDLPAPEVATAAREVLEREVRLPRADLLKEVGKAMGYPRLGRRLKEALGAGVDLAAARGWCEVEGEVFSRLRPSEHS